MVILRNFREMYLHNVLVLYIDQHQTRLKLSCNCVHTSYNVIQYQGNVYIARLSLDKVGKINVYSILYYTE